MKATQLIFTYIAFNFFVLLYNGAVGGGDSLGFPTFETPAFDPIDLSGGCGGFVDCTEYVGAVIYNLALGIIFLVQFIIALIGFIFQIVALLLTQSFTGFVGAPFWVNGLFAAYFGVSASIIVYRALRKGDTKDG